MAALRSSSLRVIVMGYIVRGPLAGHAWHHLHYVAGLVALGHDVWFIEDSDDYASCYDPVGDVMGVDPGYGLAFARTAFERIGHPAQWAYYDAHTTRWLGPGAARVVGACRTADVVINVSGINPLRPWTETIPARVLIDTDPGFTQARHLREPARLADASRHTAFFSFGEGIDARGPQPAARLRQSAARVPQAAARRPPPTVPDDGLPWQPTRQPIALSAWPVRPVPERGAFTTVMAWDSYPPVEAGGVTLGMKSQSFAPYLDLPARVGVPLELAAGGASLPRALLASHGWRVVDSREPTRSLDAYAAYIAGSRGEFSVAKHGYVVTRSGWFSERSANYLATGRPVITEDTGFSSILPCGRGLFAFSSPDEAVAAIEAVAADHDAHGRADVPFFSGLARKTLYHGPL